MSDNHYWSDGDTTYDRYGRGTRLAGANTPERGRPGAAQATAAALTAQYLGYQPTGHITSDNHKRSVQQFADQDNNSLAQAMVNAGLAAPMHGSMAHGVSPTSAGARAALGLGPTGIEADPAFQFLAEEARVERMAALDQYLASGAQAMRLPRGADPRETRGVVDRAWDRGIDNMQGTFYGFANAIGELTGSDALAQWGEEGMARNMWEALRSPATVGTYEDIDGFTDAGIYALEALVEFSPQLGLDLIAGIGTGGAAVLGKHALAGMGKSVLRSMGGPQAVAQAGKLAGAGITNSTFLNGARYGALASMYMQNSGETQMQFAMEDIDAPGTALMVGAGKAALDYVGFETILRAGFKGLAKGAATPENIRQLLGNALTAAGVAATAESITEGAQTLMDEMAVMHFKPDHEIDWSQVIDAALKGGVAGGGVAAPARATVDALKMAGEGYEAGLNLPGDDAPPQDTMPEPVGHIEAQVANTPEGEGNWYTRENAEDAERVATEQGKGVRENVDGSVFVGEQTLIDALPAEPTQEDIRGVLGYAQTKEQALADPEGTVAVETRTPDGAILRNQMVGASIAEQVRLQQQAKFPDAVVDIKQVEEIIAQREQALAHEKKVEEAKLEAKPETKPEPRWKPKGLLNKRDPAELVKKALEMGVDPTRFQKKGLGEELVRRIEGGLKTVTGVNKYKRLDSLAPLAEVLDMPAAELERTYYDKRNMFRGRELLLEVFKQRVTEKFGGPAAFAAAVDALPVPQAREIKEALGVAADGGYDVAGLVAEVEARQRIAPKEVDLDSPVEAPPTPSRKPATPDAIHQAVFQSPTLREYLTNDKGEIASPREIEDRIEMGGRRNRIKMEQWIKKLDIDVGGKNRDAFVALLEESIDPGAVYGTGSVRVDDTQTDSPSQTVQTAAGYDPTRVKSKDAKLLKAVKGTRLTKRDPDGFPSGLALYLEAVARIMRDGEPEQQSKLSEEESQRLHYARSVLLVVRGMTRWVEGLDYKQFTDVVAQHFDVTDELTSRAAGREVDAVTALNRMAAHEDMRVATSLAGLAAERLDLGGTIDEGVEALAEALADNPAKTVADLAADLYSVYGPDGINRLALISSYTVLFGESKQGGPEFTATAKGHDQGKGDDVAIDISSAYNEQAMSDSAFFGHLHRSSISNWDLAILPSQGQLDTIQFRNGISQEATRRFGGANLLALPALPGSMFGGVVDAVALARYAQSGEHQPASVHEAAGNLMENISRIMLGGQNSEEARNDGESRAYITRIPDELVIFVDPDKGTGRTWGEAMTSWREQGNAAEQVAALSRRIEETAFEADKLGEALADAYLAEVSDAVKKSRTRYPAIDEAFTLWGKMLAGEKRSVGGREVYYRKPAKRDPSGEKSPLRSAIDAIGGIEIAALEGETLDNAFDRYLTLRGQMKGLAAQRREANSRIVREQNFERNELEKVAQELDLDIDTPQGMQEAEEALRGGHGSRTTVEDQENIDHLRGRRAFDGAEPEYDSTIHDPLAGWSLADLLDGEDAAQDASIKAWYEATQETKRKLAEADKLKAEREQAPLKKEKYTPRELGDHAAIWQKVLTQTTNDADFVLIPNPETDQPGYRAAIQRIAHAVLMGRGLSLLEAAERAAEFAKQAPLNPEDRPAAVDGAPVEGASPAPASVRTLEWRRYDHPLFRLASTRMATKLPKKGMRVDEVTAIADRFVREYNGNIPLHFRIEQKQETVYGAIPEDENGRKVIIQGAYHPTGSKQAVPGAAEDGKTPGRLVLIADNLRDEADVVATLRHEILGHFGLNTFPPAIKRQVLDAILASKRVPSMMGLWREIDRRYAGESRDTKAEEVFALIVEQPQTNPNLFQRAINWLAMNLRRVGLLKGKVTRVELEAMAQQIAGAIRDGRARQRTWPQTDSASFRKQIGFDDAALKAKAKEAWKTGSSRAGAVFSMVYTRIQRYSPELALMLFQPAGKRASKHGQSWQQSQRAIFDRMMGPVSKLMDELTAPVKGRAKKQQAVQAAFEDAYSGDPQTTEGKKVRALIDGLVAEAKRSGLVSVELEEGFAPVAFDRRAIASRQGEFEKLLVEKLKLEPKDVRETVRNIVDGPGVLEGVIAPGMPVGMHQSTREIVEALGREDLIKEGWILNRHQAALFHWINGVSKRAAWEKLFGGEDTSRYELRDGVVKPRYSPNAKFHEMLDAVRETDGEQAAQEILALVNGALGRHPAGQSMPGWWRNTQEFITGWVGMTVLAFSGVASIPELTLPLVRAGGRVGISDMVRDYSEAKRLARDMGIVLSDASEQVVWQMTGEQYQSPLIAKMQSAFFKYNGNAWIIKTSRTLATGIAMRYLLNAAASNDTGALSRLNIDAGIVHAWDQAGRPAWNPDLDPTTAELATRVGAAIDQFVNEATLNPSKFQATHWGNNPWLKMIWHLKHFLYTYGDTVLGGIYREMRRRWRHLDPFQFSQALAIAAPALIFAVAILPLAAAALELRDWVREFNGQKGKEYQDSLDYFGAIFSRAGGLGPLEFLLNMREQQERGVSVFGSLAPVPAKLDMLFSEASLQAKARQLTPVAAQNPLLWPFD